MGKRKRKRKRKSNNSGWSSDEEGEATGRDNDRRNTQVLEAQRKKYESEKPLCCMCLELALPPVFSPCNCANLSCLNCFKTYIENHGSVCVTCRRRLVGSMRRGGGVENLIDKKLEADIHRRYPNGEQSIEYEEEEEELQRKRRLVPPKKGELLAQISEMNEKYESERRKEIEATEAFLKQDEETRLLLERLERQKKDEELARKLQEEEHSKKKENKSKNLKNVDPISAQKLQKQENRQQDLNEDEILARKLQAEEDKKKLRDVNVDSNGTSVELKNKYRSDVSPLRSQRRKSKEAKNIFKSWTKSNTDSAKGKASVNKSSSPDINNNNEKKNFFAVRKLKKQKEENEWKKEQNMYRSSSSSSKIQPSRM